MKVYVIMKGEYSDIHVAAVTLDREKADKLAKFHTSDFFPSWVDVYETDDTPDKTLDAMVPVYRVSIQKDGKTFVNLDSYYAGASPYEPKFSLDDGTMLFRAYLTARDEEHAVKIARDRRAKMIAERMGL